MSVRFGLVPANLTRIHFFCFVDVDGGECMGIIYKKAEAKKKAKCSHSKALAVNNLDLSQPGRLRVGHLMALFQISHSSVYKRLAEADSRLPPPDGRDPRPYWHTSTIRDAL